jgi:riboflavin kinase/FMN adenylyltransferase
MGIDVVCGEGLQMEDYRLQTKDEGGPLFVSSSVIRRLLGEGRVEEAALALGRPYSLKGVVVHGEQVGRKIGYPTANISPDACRLIPKNGVYAVRVMLSPLNSQFSTLNSQFSPLPGMTNIGLRPTFDGHRQTIETHLLDFHGDLYGQPIQLLFISRLREERQFDSPDALARQMAEDELSARNILNKSQFSNLKSQL